MSLIYRTHPKDYDATFDVRMPIDMLEDLQMKASALNIYPDELILRVIAKDLERSQRRISNQKDRDLFVELGQKYPDISTSDLLGLQEEILQKKMKSASKLQQRVRSEEDAFEDNNAATETVSVGQS